jgi:hypothetical protein
MRHSELKDEFVTIEAASSDPWNPFGEQALSNAESFENLDAATRGADGTASVADGVSLLQENHGDAMPDETKGQGESDRTGTDNGNGMKRPLPIQFWWCLKRVAWEVEIHRKMPPFSLIVVSDNEMLTTYITRLERDIQVMVIPA